MAFKDKERAKEYNKKWYEEKRKNNPEFKVKKKEKDQKYHENYKNPNLTPERSIAYSKKYREKNIEKVRKKDREYKKRTYSDKTREQNKLWRENNKEKILAWRAEYVASGKQEWSRIKMRYGLTKEEYFNLLELQGNCCGLCKMPFSEKNSEKKCVDHCHQTGKVRGIIHHGCNIMLGLAKDNQEKLQLAIDYLNKNNEISIIESS